MTQTSVYMIVNRYNGQSYIGVSRVPQLRFREHVLCARSGRWQYRFHHAIRKYGPDAFTLFILKECSDFKSALAEERRCIATYSPEYNMTAGGEGVLGVKANLGKKFSEDHRRKMSDGQHRAGVCRSVKCLDDGQVYSSVIQAARAYGIAHSGNISRVARALQINPHSKWTVNGLRFEYLSERNV